jgi:hypothetical protein
MRFARGLGALVVLAVAVVPAAGARSSATDPPSLNALLGTFAPIVVLHPSESFVPVPVAGYLADSDLEQHDPATGVWQKIPGPLPVGAAGAGLRLNQRLCDARDGVAAIPCYADAQAAHSARPTVYGAAFRRGNRIALQYWLFYPYDAYSPTVPAGQIWQVHEGDWESASVILDGQGTPLWVGLSRHSEGARRAWADAPKRETHPVVYVALGSHANYFTRGVQPFSPLWVPKQLIQIIRSLGALPADHTAKGRVLHPIVVHVNATTPKWMAFAGTWGETQYLHARAGQDAVAFGTGPRGPVFHEQWRRPISDVMGWPVR